MLRVGVIGCGSIAKQRHGYEYFHNANVEIKGFFDRRQERVEALTALYGGRVYATIDEMLADSEIDAVSVCLANAAHADVGFVAGSFPGHAGPDFAADATPDHGKRRALPVRH